MNFFISLLLTGSWRTTVFVLMAVSIVAGWSGCDDGSDDTDGGYVATLACNYESQLYFSGTGADEWTAGCLSVSSNEQCDRLTETSTDCGDGYCARTQYRNVHVVDGACGATSVSDGTTDPGSGMSCRDLVHCLDSCVGSDDAGCSASCADQSCSEAITKYNEFVGCANAHCPDYGSDCISTACAGEINTCGNQVCP